MKKAYFTLILIVTMLSCNKRQESFTFVHMTDPQIGFMDTSANYINSDTLMKAAVTAVNSLKPSYVFMTGDLVNEPTNMVQDSIYRVRKAELTSPVFEIPGNHDIRGYTKQTRDFYLSLRGYDRFSFEGNGCAFVGFDSTCIKDGATQAEEEQFAWLEKELESYKDCAYTFVFLHCPIIREKIDEEEDYSNFSLEKRERYLGLFKKYGVDAVFSGHCHQEWVSEYDGMGLYCAGPVGNALGHGTPGYNVVKVTKEGFTVEYVPTPGVARQHGR